MENDSYKISTKGSNPVNRPKKWYYFIIAFLETLFSFNLEATMLKRKIINMMFAIMIIIMVAAPVMAADVTDDDSWVKTLFGPLVSIQTMISFISPWLIKLLAVFLIAITLMFMFKRLFAPPAETKEEYAENVRTTIMVPSIMIVDKVTTVIIGSILLAMFGYVLFAT